MTEPREGDILAGKFRIERVLGVGGMGMVVSAMHIHLDERVAIKFLLPEALSNGEAVARFGREARAAVKIKSEHVARVIDVGALETGAPYMVMELLRGHDLSNILRDSGALPVHLAVQYVLQACEALAEAHAIGIVHRDLKPANLFLTARADGSPCIKVLDFGISKVTGKSGSGSDMGMTRTQSIMGSPLYMSPEQMASAKDVDQRSDIWAIGCVLYELVTGRVPFEAETMPQLCTLILHAEPPSPRTIRPEIPEQLEQAILRCLRKPREQRYANVAALANDLAFFAPDAGPRSAERISKVLSSSGITSPELSSSNLHSRTAGANTASQAWGNTQTARKSRAMWLGLAGGAAVVAIALIAWKATSSPHTAPPEGTAVVAAKPPAEPPTAVAPPVAAAPAPAAPAVPTTTPSAAPPVTAAPAPEATPTPGTKPKPSVRPTAKPKPGEKPKPSGGGDIDPLSERN
ncbi:MAG TPA: serine/threonine-protein kinase [Polyangiaceae bacterium]|nr:serine/threonine-protein kinase [Polyangiaceae bacterium]